MLTTIIFLFFFTLSYGEKGCKISTDIQTGDLSEPQPLILSSSLKILHPDVTGTLTLSSGETILLACPNKNNNFETPLDSQQVIKATCYHGKQFKVNGKSYPFDSFTCRKSPKPDIKRKGTCLDQFSKYEAGFRLLNNFIPIYEICRADDSDETYYAKAEMSSSIGAHQTKNPRPAWIHHNLFHQNVQLYYTQKHQKEFLKQLLGSEKLSQEYFKKAQLQRGHLAARSDFVYGTEQNATFTYANAAPQWSTFNMGNWVYIENAVRKFVEGNDLRVTIYTGVHGQMSLLDVNGEEQLLSLDIDENNNNYITVPKFFWKIVYDPVEQSALTLVGVNDPFRKKITKDMLLCKDISDNYAWLTETWKKRTSISAGFSYVCDYNELRKRVDTVPNLKVKGSLSSTVQIVLDPETLFNHHSRSELSEDN